MLKNSKTDWGSVSKSFHWLTLLLLIALFTLGWIMVDMAFSPNKFKFYSWHKSLGMIVLALTALRLSWRWVNRVPKHADNKLEQFIANTAHNGLYALLFAIPLTGWLMSSAAGLTVNVFGLFEVPNLIAPNKELVEFFHEVHEWLGWALLGLVGVHAGAAIYHHIARKDDVLARMTPCGRRLLGRPLKKENPHD